MRAATTAVQNYLNAMRASPDAEMIMADCYTFTLRTGAVLTYTNAPFPIILNSYTYLASSIRISGLKFKCSVGLDVDQQQISIAAYATDTVGGVPFLQALNNGVFDGCEIQREQAFLNSWDIAGGTNPIGSVILFKGRIGAIDSIGRTSAQITVNSDLVLLDMQMPKNVYSPFCQHVLYDSGCTMVKTAHQSTGVVGAGSTNAILNWASAAQNFAQGTLLFTSGANNGLSVNIKSVVTSVSMTYSYPLLIVPAPGDTFTAFWGCDHTQATCNTKFSNMINFRGFPYTPSPSFAIY